MIKNKSILELRKMLDNKEVSSEELFLEAKNMSKESQERYNPYVTILEDYNHINSDSLIDGIPYALKDNFSTSGILTTASSNILKDYVPVFDSTVYEKLKCAGAVLVGKTVLDELAMGGSGLTGHTGYVRNPLDLTRRVGGSSAGSAVVVNMGIVPFAIGSDTGDSIRKPASYTGIVGFKPTYGRISRFGLIPYASSMDTVGIMARNVKDIAIVTDILKGRDEKDMTSLPSEDINYSDNLNSQLSGKKLFYIKEVIESASSLDAKEIVSQFMNLVEKLRSNGVLVEEVSIDKNILEAVNPAYFIISCAESTSNNSNLTGYIFGPREEGNTPEEIMKNTRTKGFSEMIKRRFVIGSYALEKENQEKLFLNAQRLRNMIVTKMNELFEKYDGYILPTMGTIAPKIDGDDIDKLSSEYLLLESHLDIANFGGFPSISLPLGKVNDMPIGVSLTTKAKDDLNCLSIASGIEKILGGETNV